MRVERLRLKNFRNCEDLDFRPSPSLNFILGNNGQGKTSILEGLGFLSLLRSFRGSKNFEVVRHEQERAEVFCTLSDGTDWRTELRVDFSVDLANRDRAKKTAFINGKPYKSTTAFLSQRFGQSELGFHSVVFNPSDHDLVRGDPGTRRAYLDRVLSAEDVDYLKTYQKYYRILEQKNALLKAVESPASDLLMGFTEPMGQYSAALTQKRLAYIERLSKRLFDTANKTAPMQPDLRLIYLSNWVPEIDCLSLTNNKLGPVHFSGHGAVPSLETLEQAFWKKQSSVEAAERKAKHCLVGPHRDDWAFYFGERLLQGHGSQGEVRSSLLALKLCEVDLFREATGHRPIFLLDDFSSELDAERRNFLLEFLREKDLQVFVTTTDESQRTGKCFFVTNGKLQEQKEMQQKETSSFNDVKHE